MKKKLLHILIGCILYTSFPLVAQQNILTFKQLTINDGLSQNSVNCIHQDKTGFMWFGTQDGLNRYDGYNFIQYRNERNNPNSISNNYIWDLYEDDDNILWLATFGGGLNSFNLLTEEIKIYKPIPNDSTSFPSNRLFSIIEYPKGILWIGSNEGLIKFNKSTGYSEIFLSEKTEENTLKDNYIGIVSKDEQNNLWLRTNLGLTRFNTTTNTAEYFKQSPFSNTINLGDIYDIKNSENKILVACSAGLIEIDPVQKTDRLLLSATTIKTGNRTPIFQKILLLGNQRFVIGTNVGLIIFNSKTKQHYIYQNEANDIKSLSHNNVLSLLKSKDEIIWIGTRNGLNKIETENPDFIHIRHITGENGLSSKNVNSFMEENDSLLWVGTTNGLNLYNKNNNAFKVFKKNERNNNALSTNYMLCLFKDSKGNKWVGTRGNGFFKINGSSKTGFEFKHIQPKNKKASTISIHFITEDKDGFLWLGTGGQGLWKYNPIENSVKKYTTAKDGSGPNHPYIFTILQDSFDNFWLGTPTGGLNAFNPKTEKFLYFQNNPGNQNSLSNDIILSLYEDNQHQLWISTNSGLNKLIPKLEKNMFDILKKEKQKNNDSLFINFGQEQGFPNEVLYGILEDENQNLWISTNKGLVSFNIQNEKVTKTFDVSHGLQNNEFNQNAYYEATNEQFYFGGVNGFTIFSPENIKGNPYIPPIALTKLSILNETLKVGEKASNTNFILSKSLHNLDEISLSWKDDVITFDFAALSYISSEKNQYSYKLEGFNDNWILSKNTHTTTYTNLDPGDYIFKVRASNSSNVWNQKGTSLKINISSPPWLRWYAYLFYFLALSSVLYVLFRYRINQATRKIKVQAQIEKARIEEREAFRKRSAQDFHDEAGNKITRISLITELAKRNSKGNKEVLSYLDKIEENIQELNSGMRDFIWALDPSNDNLYETLFRFSDFAGKFCEYGEIQFKMNPLPNSLKSINFDMSKRRHLLFILKEALNNTLKYAEATLVELNVTSNATTFTVSLKDDGIGFNSDKISKGSGLKNIKERAESIDANYTLLSEKNKGTELILAFQITQMGN